MKRLAVFSMVVLTAFACATSANAALVTVFDEDYSGAVGGTLNGDASVSGGVLNLDGVGDYHNDVTTVLTATDDYVVEAIFNATAFGDFNFIVYNGNTGNSGGQGVLQEGGTLDGIVPGVALQDTSAAAGTGVNVALALVRVAGASTVYVNGVAQATGGDALAPSSAASQLLIGAGVKSSGGTEGHFNGAIDRVRLSAITGTFDADDLLGPGDGAIPEPALMGLMGLGGLLMLCRCREA